MSPYFKTTANHTRATRRVLRLSLKLLTIVLYVLAVVQPRDALGQAKSGSAQKAKPLADQHFVCNTGYSKQSCHEQCQRLAVVLLHYQAALPRNWTWVLVRSDDWRSILQGLNLHEQSPAFTVLSKRQTFLNEALFRTDARSSAQLLSDFAVPLDQVLDYAVAHELGHAFCMETRERETALSAEQLTKTGSMQCYGSPERNIGPTTRDTVRTLDPPK